MWRHKDGKIVLNLSKINKTEFKIVSESGLNLIIPKKNKWDWTEEEKWLRSIVVDDEGFIVSCSWKKFGNFGEFLTETNVLKNALANNKTVRFSHKEDGTLCVRSCYKGQVILRTRGTLFGGESDGEKEAYGEKFLRVIKNKYPKLLDPNWMSDVTLLLEYIAPDNTVVIRYKEEDLVFLGGINHLSLSIIPWDEVVKISIEGGLRLVSLCELPSDPIKLLEEVKEWKTEGVVARCCEDQIFVKVKSAWYLANHRMKNNMSYAVIMEFCERSNILNEEMLVNKLREYDYDFEIIESAKEFYYQYVSAQKLAQEQKDFAESLYNKIKLEMGIILFSNEASKRKYFAKAACAQIPIIKTMLFALYDNKIECLNNMMRKIISTEGKGK